MQNSTVLNQILPTKGFNTYLKNIIFILLGTLALTAAAKVQVPFWPVPMTMQTFIVFVIGATFGSRLAFLTCKRRWNSISYRANRRILVWNAICIIFNRLFIRKRIC